MRLRGARNRLRCNDLPRPGCGKRQRCRTSGTAPSVGMKPFEICRTAVEPGRAERLEIPVTRLVAQAQRSIPVIVVHRGEAIVHLAQVRG